MISLRIFSFSSSCNNRSPQCNVPLGSGYGFSSLTLNAPESAFIRSSNPSGAENSQLNKRQVSALVIHHPQHPGRRKPQSQHLARANPHLRSATIVVRVRHERQTKPSPPRNLPLDPVAFSSTVLLRTFGTESIFGIQPLIDVEFSTRTTSRFSSSRKGREFLQRAVY